MHGKQVAIYSPMHGKQVAIQPCMLGIRWSFIHVGKQVATHAASWQRGGGSSRCCRVAASMLLAGMCTGPLSGQVSGRCRQSR